MKWHFWKDTEDFIYILPLVAFWNGSKEVMFKFGWLRWRCGFYKEKEERK